jgi:hypothetical protein
MDKEPQKDGWMYERRHEVKPEVSHGIRNSYILEVRGHPVGSVGRLLY